VSHRRPALRAAAALAAVTTLGLLTGCTSHTTHCSASSCTVDLTGAQTVDIDPSGDYETNLRVGPIEPGAVTIATSDAAARLTPGRAAQVSDLRVEVVSVSGQDVRLRVDRL
jgi:hypothetical protein